MDTYDFLLSKSAWKTAFTWLKTVTPATPEGIQKIQGDDIYVNVHGYKTLPATDCRFESHERYLDLQYCITGGEWIDWCLISNLKPEGAFNSEKDVQFFSIPKKNTPVATLPMVPGSFAIFSPSDAHAPKRMDGTNSSVFKLVIKLDRKLVL